MFTWTTRSLHPDIDLIRDSFAISVWGRQQVGFVRMHDEAGGTNRAAHWVSHRHSFRSLHPTSATASKAYCLRDSAVVGSVVRGGAALPFRWDGLDPAGFLLGDGSGEAYAHSRGWSGGLQNVDAHLWHDDGSVVTLHEEQNGAIHGQSQVTGMFEHQQVGTVWKEVGLRAYLWEGALESGRTLHPSSSAAANVDSEAHGVHGGIQVGRVGHRACLWGGTPESHRDLHPPSALSSIAKGIHDSIQVGHVMTPTGPEACAWAGAPATSMNLHAALPPWFNHSTANGVWRYANGLTLVVGHGYRVAPNRTEALLWVGRPI